jgi:hypothetical protein
MRRRSAGPEILAVEFALGAAALVVARTAIFLAATMEDPVLGGVLLFGGPLFVLAKPIEIDDGCHPFLPNPIRRG